MKKKFSNEKEYLFCYYLKERCRRKIFSLVDLLSVCLNKTNAT